MRVKRWYLPKVGLLLIFCGLPYLLRDKGEHWEPYPALLLPSGGRVVNVGGSYVTTPRIELLSVAVDGHEHELSPTTFFEPLPDPYWVRIALAGLALNPTAASKGKATTGGSMESRIPAVSESRRAEIEDWLRKRLAAVGRDGDRVLRVRLVRLTLSTAQHRELQRKTSWTYDIQL